MSILITLCNCRPNLPFSHSLGVCVCVCVFVGSYWRGILTLELMLVISKRWYDLCSHRYGTSHNMHPVCPSQAPEIVSCVDTMGCGD